MLAFHNSADLKAKKLKQVLAHQAADEIVKGQYWQGGKGCAVGCTIHGSNHGDYETKMGVPRMLARLEDLIFEGMPNADAKLFPARFIEAIPVGADLSLVGWKFLHWLIVDVNERHGNEQTKAAVVDAIEILRKKANDEVVNRVDAYNAAEITRTSARAARAAADAAADAAAARKSAFARQAEKLLELLAAAPVAEPVAA